MATKTAQTMTVRTHKNGPVTVPTVWVGAHLAVHGTVENGTALPHVKRRYTITHLSTGRAVCRVSRVKQTDVVRLARLWDSRFADITAESDAASWRYRETWASDIRAVCNGAEPTGPILPDHPTSADVGRAITAAVCGDPGPSVDDSGDDSAPYPVTGRRTRQTSDGLEMSWRGEWFPVPTMAEVEEMICDSVCETPDGRTVEPDHPESWLSILGLI